MANIKSEQERLRFKLNVLNAAAKLFLQKGYSNSTTREIAQTAGVNVTTMNKAFGSKENILCQLVAYVLEGQFESATKLISGVTEDKLLFYATETTLQLYMAESDANIRNLYAAAYSLPKSAEIIQQEITGKLQYIFKEYLPDLTRQDFYELEVVSGGIMRSCMANPCDGCFTIERKVRLFIESAFRVYRVPEEKILEAIAFVQQFDYPTIAQNTINSMLKYLEDNMG